MRSEPMGIQWRDAQLNFKIHVFVGLQINDSI
jgi:hypothetical protein